VGTWKAVAEQNTADVDLIIDMKTGSKENKNKAEVLSFLVFF
jgi:hypothetical protein